MGIQLAQAQATLREGADQQRPQRGFPVGTADQRNAIAPRRRAGQDGAVDPIHQRPQEQVDHQNDGCQQPRQRQGPGTGHHADGRRTPQRCGGVQAVHGEPVAEDQPCPQKADARDDLGRDPRRAGIAGKQGREDHEAGGPQRNEGVCAHARHAVAGLPFHADDGPAERGKAHLHCRVVKGDVQSPYASSSASQYR